MKALICYNPFSGKQKIESKLDYIITKLKTKYEVVDVFRSLEEKTITLYIESFGSNYDLILVCGGDGSLNEAINGLMHIEKRPKLAYIPVGTVNDVGHMLKLNKSLKKVLKIIVDGNSTKMDVCQLEDKYFIYACGVGKFTNVSYDAPSKLKRHVGKMAYFLEAAKELQKDDTITLEINTNNRIITGDYYVMLALNSKRIAGFRLYRSVKPKLNDGIIDLTLVSKARYRMSIVYLVSFFLFGDRIKNGVETIKINEATIRSNKELSFNLDGEFAFKKKEVKLKVINKAVDIIVSKKTKKKYFL